MPARSAGFRRRTRGAVAELLEWSSGFFETLAADGETSKVVDDILGAIRRNRRSKPARRL